MLTEVRFLGIDAARALKPSLGTAVISILDHSENHRRPPRLRAFKDCLILDFVDTYEAEGADPWPDKMTPAEHALVCADPFERAPDLADAEAIVTFVRKHHWSSEPTRLVVHCYGGVSRSAAVAQWVGVVHGVPLPQLGDGVHTLDRANPRLLRLLDKAAGRR